jgi:SAM-dependent methyltransferase
MEDLFFEIHKDLPREGPGDRESTERAFSMLSSLPPRPLVLDIGCGPGMQTLHLARLTRSRVIALDKHQPYIAQLMKRVLKRSHGHKVHATVADMNTLPFLDETFDLIWSEGAIYLIGFANGLRQWKPLLKPEGFLAVTEITWLDPDPPREVKAFWGLHCPAMQGKDQNIQTVREEGYHPLGTFQLPESAWWKDYYTPLQKRLTRLRKKYKSDPKALALLDEEQAEIDLYRAYARHYGYVFYVMQRNSGSHLNY